MFCKYCGNELPVDVDICPACGEFIGEEKQKAPVYEQSEMEEKLIPDEVEGSEMDADSHVTEWDEPIAPKKQAWKLPVIIAGIVVLAALLVTAVLFGSGILGGDSSDTTPETTLGNNTSAPTEQVNFTSYTVDDATAVEKSNDVIATVGKLQLTNSELQMHYWSQVYNFLNQYGYYLSAVGLDVSKGLDEQACYFDATKSWQEYFLDQAIQGWQSYAVLCEMADQEGFVLDAEAQAYLDNLDAEVLKDAQNNGYESVEALLEAEGGPGFTKDGYMHYVSLMYKSMEYFNVKYEGMTPTEDEAIAYFVENEATYLEKGVKKDGSKTVDVRHILIKPEGGTKDESGNTTYSDAEWDACKTKAEQVYQTWQDGEATEDSFAELAKTQSADGSAANGGLYTDVTEGYMVETFNDWIMDSSRQPGDHGLVKTEFGYHVMYYVAGHEIWLSTAESDLLNERFTTFINGGMEQFPMESDYSKIGLGYISLAGEN